jgi:hypothetical protein
MDGCVKDLSNSIFEIGGSCLLPLAHAVGENAEKSVSCQQKLISQKPIKINVTDFLKNIPVHYIRMSTLCLYSKCHFFAAKSIRYILFALVDHLSEPNQGILRISLKIFSP